MGAFADGLVLPALALSVLGWLVPCGLALVVPEGVRPLLALAVTSAALMLLLGAALFAALYASRGVPWDVLLGAGGGGHVLRLGAISALLWGPILLLTVADLPRRWTRATW